MKQLLSIYYDKECPFCNAYAHYIKLKENYILDLKNARDEPQELLLLCQYININDGFIVVYQKRCYQGVDALVLLNRLTCNKGAIAFIQKIFQKNNLFSKIIYTVILNIRKVVLYFLGIKAKI